MPWQGAILTPIDIDSAQWSFIRENRQYGPISTYQMQEHCRGRIIQGDTQVRCTLFDWWAEADTVPALRTMMGGASQPVNPQLALFHVPSTALRWSGFATGPRNWASSLTGLALCLVVGVWTGGLNWLKGPGGRELEVHIGASLGAAAAAIVLAMVIGWIVGAVGGLCFGRRQAFARSGLAIGALLIVLANTAYQLQLIKRGVASIVQGNAIALQSPSPRTQNAANLQPYSVVELDGAATRPTGVPAPSKPKAVPKSESEKMGEVISGAFSELEDAGIAYRAKMKGLGLEQIVKPERLLDKGTYPGARRACRSAYAAITDYQSKVNTIVQTIPTRLAKAGVSEKTQKAFMSGFEKSRRESQQYLNEMFSLERQAVDHISGALDVVENSVGEVKIGGGKLLFPSGGEANAYNQHRREFFSVLDYQKRLGEDRTRRAREVFEMLQRAAAGAK